MVTVGSEWIANTPQQADLTIQPYSLYNFEPYEGFRFGINLVGVTTGDCIVFFTYGYKDLLEGLSEIFDDAQDIYIDDTLNEITPVDTLIIPPIANYTFIDQNCSGADNCIGQNLGANTFYVTDFGGSYRGQTSPGNGAFSCGSVALSPCPGEIWTSVTSIVGHWRFRFQTSPSNGRTWYFFDYRVLQSGSWSDLHTIRFEDDTYNHSENEWIEIVFPIAEVGQIDSFHGQIRVQDVSGPFDNAAQYIWLKDFAVYGTKS